MDPRKLVKYNEEDEEYIEEEDQQFQDEPMVVFDDKQLKEIITLLDHNFKLNSDLRMRYPNQPDKFIDSEVELDEEIRKLQTLPAYPELYPLFYNSNALSIIVQLLLHNNQDLVNDVVQFFKELVSPEVDVNPKIIIQLYDNLVKNYFIETLGELIMRNQEVNQDDVNLLHDCFEIIENMVDIRQSFCKEFGYRSKILQYLTKRLEDDSQAIDDNRLYAAELLVMLCQQTEENLEIIGRSGGIESLLIVLSQYRKKDPDTIEEKEIVNNVFDLLNLLLTKEENQEYFSSYEGLQLMIKIIQGKTSLAIKAYKLILLAINNFTKNCQTLISIGGLSIIFPILSRKGLKNSETNKQFEIDDITVQIIKQLFRCVKDEALKKRLSAKCTEKLADFKKLRTEYVDIIPLIDPEEYDSLDEKQLEKVYFDLLGQGLIVIESIDVILLELLNLDIVVDVEKSEISSSVKQMLKYAGTEEDKQYYGNLLKKIEVDEQQQ